MNFSVNRNSEELLFANQLPPELLPYKVFPTNFISIGSWGTIIFQELATPEFSVWYTLYLINEESSFTIKSDIETIDLHITLKNTLQFNTTGLKRVKIKQHHFNLNYLPSVHTTGYFTPGKYKTLDISYSKEYLSRYVPYLKGLDQFMLDMENKIPGRLHPVHLAATPEMIAAINSILHHKHNSGLSRIYIDIKVQELLTLSVEKIGSETDRKFSLSQDDITRIEKVHTWLTDHLDYSGSLIESAQQFQTNDFKLKRGFKELYGTTVFDMLITLRMERAKQMLLETQLSVTEIGYRAGYSSGSHFTNAFRKHFGYPPTFLRKK